MAVAVFDPASSTLEYASAGHPPFLLRRAASNEVIIIDDALGPLLGPLRDVTFTDGEMAIAADDVLVLYTDGLVERLGWMTSAWSRSASPPTSTRSPVRCSRPIEKACGRIVVMV